MRDFKVKVGKGIVIVTVGHFGLVQFCQKVDSEIMNSFFQLPLRRLYTWNSPLQKVIRNQIEDITVNKRFQNSVKSTKPYSGGDVP